MKLDVRLPIGLLFIIVGLILVFTGLTSDPAAYAKSLHLNINLWWGIVMALFGGIMLFLVKRSQGKK
jgi:hypothetical protein